jgi:hypothetical protein
LESRGSLTNPILTNNALMLDPVLLLTQLRDIAFNKRTRKKPTTTERLATAMATNTRTCTCGCRNKKHNPLVKTHSKENCWAIHLEKVDAYLSAQHHTNVASHPPPSSSSQHQTPAFAAGTLAQCYFTRAPSTLTFLNSGAFHHIFNNLEFFQDTKACSIPISTGRNSYDLTAIQIGVSLIAQSDGRVVRLEDSLFVPGLCRNLLSLTRMVKKTTLLSKGVNQSCITIDNHITFNCHHRNNILEIIGEIGPVPREIVALVSTTHPSPTSAFNMWHSCLGHAGIARLKAVLPGVNLVKSGSCDSCMKSKVARIPFKIHFDATKHPLQVVHSDLVGPITPSTNSGARYFITLVDRHTGFISITLLKKKSKATEAILDLKTFYEKQTGFAMKKLITNGGGEFCNHTLSNILNSHSIQHNVAPPYTLQHNGVAEQANKTIINMARSMLVQTRLAKEWWRQAVRTAALTTNCLPSLAKSNVTPLE